VVRYLLSAGVTPLTLNNFGNLQNVIPYEVTLCFYYLQVGGYRFHVASCSVLRVLLDVFAALFNALRSMAGWKTVPTPLKSRTTHAPSFCR
jgi:hypothetical protein